MNDIAALIAAGKKIRTRDRREVAGLAIDADGISGSVPMVGACRWRHDGRYQGAPGGSAGPLDLVPAPEIAAEPEHAAETPGALLPLPPAAH